jgi:DNA gyrase/topoisomerase IV subunit B
MHVVQDYKDTTSLRYGHIMIMTDQDHDGSHIKGLLMNFMHHFYPSLLKVPGFLIEFITPIVKVIIDCDHPPSSDMLARMHGRSLDCGQTAHMHCFHHFFVVRCRRARATTPRCSTPCRSTRPGSRSPALRAGRCGLAAGTCAAGIPHMPCTADHVTYSENRHCATFPTQIKYYKGLGTSNTDEAREYFSKIDKHRKEFKWLGEC